jgi:transposase
MVFVRAISDAEGRELRRLARRSRDSVVARRAAVVRCSAQGMSVPEITGTIFADAGHIRAVLKDFNERGFAALRPGRSPGRPRQIDEQTRARIVAVALSRPQDRGLPFTHWSLPKLPDYLIETDAVESISHEGIRQVLAERGISLQRTKTWKQSNDPEFERKKGLFFASTDAAAAAAGGSASTSSGRSR